MTEETAKKPADLIAEWMTAHGVTVESVFIPWSQSRNAPNPKAKDERGRKGWRSLNWEVTIKRNGRHVLTTEYAAGEGHCPAYKAFGGVYGKRLVWQFDTITREIETGFEHGTTYETCGRPKGKTAFIPAETLGYDSYGRPIIQAGRSEKRKQFTPKAADVLASLALDSSVLDSGTFEDWAAEYGYDSDSREAEKTYRQCLDIALKLRAAIGDAGLQSLRDACQDY